MEKKIKCLNCGAEFSRELAKCPHCNAIYEWGAEKKYMQNLERIKEDLADIPEQVQKTYKKEASATWKKIFVIVGAATVLVGVLAGIFAGIHKTREKSYETDLKAQLLWEKENFPKMDEWYAQGDYDAILEWMYECYEDEGYAVWNWEHYSFISAYDSYLSFMDSIDDMKNAESVNKRAFQYTTSSAMYLAFFLKEKNYAPEEWKLIQEWQADAEEALYDELGFTKEEVQELYEKINHDGYIDYDECDNYTNKIWKSRQ